MLISCILPEQASPEQWRRLEHIWLIFYPPALPPALTTFLCLRNVLPKPTLCHLINKIWDLAVKGMSENNHFSAKNVKLEAIRHSPVFKSLCRFLHDLHCIKPDLKAWIYMVTCLIYNIIVISSCILKSDVSISLPFFGNNFTHLQYHMQKVKHPAAITSPSEDTMSPC